LHILKGYDVAEFMGSGKKDVIEGTATVEALKNLIHLMLLTIQQNMDAVEKFSS
jgi:hypothetical protein